MKHGPGGAAGPLITKSLSHFIPPFGHFASMKQSYPSKLHARAHCFMHFSVDGMNLSCRKSFKSVYISAVLRYMIAFISFSFIYFILKIFILKMFTLGYNSVKKLSKKATAFQLSQQKKHTKLMRNKPIYNNF